MFARSQFENFLCPADPPRAFGVNPQPHVPEKAGEADGSASSNVNQEALNRDSSTTAGNLIGAK